MIRTSLLLKPATILAAVLFAVASWAADLSDEQEGAYRFFCIKLAKDSDYNIVIQLSQQDASYEPAQNESCFEKWFSPEGDRTAYTYIGELIYDSSNPPKALELTSDIDFGGYNEQTKSCNEEFWPFDFEVSDPITLRSVEDNAYTIGGLCYTTLSGEASFGGGLIGSIQNVRFENVRLESLTFSSLFGTIVEEPDVNNVYVANAVISAPTAGLFVSSTEGLYVTDFEGSSITVRSIPDMDLRNAVDLIYPSSVNIGGLAGHVNRMHAVGVSIDGLNVSNNAYVGDNAASFVQEVAQVEAHIGGIAGHVGLVELVRVGLDYSLLNDDAVLRDNAVEGQYSYMGGLVGSITYDLMVWFQSTYSYSDISCSEERGPTYYCKAGYIAGLVEFSEPLYKGANDMSLVSNFHYTLADYDSASGMFGEAYCDYQKSYMPNNQQEHISCVYEFNTYGELSVLDDGDEGTTLVSKTFAYGNYRSATENTYASQDFDPDTYMIGGVTRDAVSVGVIDREYMQGQAFANVLNRFNSEYGNTSVEWISDNSRDYPYVASTYRASSADDYAVQVTFVLDCVENTGCLTSQERDALESLYDFSDGNYTVTFNVDQSGRIANEAWLQFAYSLTEPNPDRASVYWESYPYQPFSIDNTYDYSVTYYLSEADDSDIDTSEAMAYVFFGTGVDYENSAVGIFSYEGESVENRGADIDVKEYSGGSDPVVMQAGPLMRIVESDLVMKDGREFKGWKVRAALWSPDGYDVLRNKAFAGMNLPVDDEGYFSLYDNMDTLAAVYQRAVLGECYELSRENPAISADSLRKLATICSQKSEEYETAFDNVIIALAVYPKGFEAENELEDDSGNTKPGEPEKKVTYPALFYAGNAIQLAVKTDKFVYEENAPFVSVLLEDLSGVPLVDSLFEFTDGVWPEIFTWEKYPLAPGRYLLTAKIYDGKNQNPEVRQWDFEVKAQIAESGNGEWHMVSLWNVDFDNYGWSDDDVFYWWDEFSIFGKYWQYKEFSKKDTPERGKGYWYNSLEGRSLQLKDTVYTEAMAWHFDSVNTGWNLVSNPYGWFVDIGAESNEFGKEWYDEQVKWLEEEASNREDVDEEWLREEMEWIEEERLMHQPAVEFFHWDPVAGQYEEVKTLAPYEAVWAKVNKGQAIDWELQPVPAFVATVNEDGDTVMVKSLKKKGVLAKAAGNSGWALQLVLSDAKGKMDSWNMVGVGKVAWSSEEPPAGMGDHVNLSIMDAGRRLAKSVKEQNGDAEYEWNVELTATSERVGNLKLVGIDGIRASGLRVFLTVDGSTVELNDDGGVQVRLSATPKVANIRVAKSARPVIAQNLQGLFARDAGNVLQVGFDASEGLAGAKARVDLVDMKGKVVRSMNFKAESGRNEVSFEKPNGGLYILRAAAGSKVATQKVLLK